MTTVAATSRVLGIAVALEDDLTCPGLTAAPVPPGEVPTRVVRAGSDVEAGWDPARAVVTRELRHGARLAFRVEHADGDGYRLEMPAAGVFRIDEAGTTIACSAAHGDEANGVGLLTQAIPLAATLRGFEPFHAAGVVLDGRAALIAGPVGAGKSSVALHLVLGGAALLADDVVAATAPPAGPLAHAGARLLRVRAAERASVPERLEGRLEVVPGLDSRLQLQAPAAPAAAPLAGVYLLRRADGDGPDVEAEPASGIDLLALTYNLSVTAPERRLRQLELCQAIAEHVPVRRAIVRPGRPASALAAAIAADLRAA